jgi:uncharacterized protein YydD (DUF2326 family)
VIKAVRANQASFKAVSFSGGFNVIVADRTTKSTKKDSRNGLGKTTLVEIIHFCLGGKGDALRIPQLQGWEFELEFVARGNPIRVWRSVDKPGTVTVEADTTQWPIKPERRPGGEVFQVAAWNALLGWLEFGLPTDTDSNYEPTFRSLISYFIRKGGEAYAKPFTHYPQQLEWDKQVNTAFLLGLAYEDASKWQRLKDKDKLLKALKHAARTGVMRGMLGSVGELEADKVRLDAEIAESAKRLGDFQVHPRYRAIRESADQLTEEMHRLANENVADEQLATFYESAARDEQAPGNAALREVYEAAGVTLPDIVMRRFDEVEAFHHTLISNRRGFLSGEIGRLRHEIVVREELLRRKSDERAEHLRVLQTHGALEEYTELQRAHLSLVARMKDLEIQIGNLKRFESGQSEVKIEKEVLQQEARRDYDERQRQRERAIALFNQNSEALYSVPGRLVIDVGQTGFKFDVEIQRSGSQGVSSMKVFCYDLMLASLWADRDPSPRLLVHDSSIFDPVDERQVANALVRAAEESKRQGFQYICMLNSDKVPTSDLPAGFDLAQFVRLRLTDATEGGGLLGFRF